MYKVHSILYIDRVNRYLCIGWSDIINVQTAQCTVYW